MSASGQLGRRLFKSILIAVNSTVSIIYLGRSIHTENRVEKKHPTHIYLVDRSLNKMPWAIKIKYTMRLTMENKNPVNRC